MSESETHLPVVVLEALDKALAGDSRAWGILYAAAAAYARAGAPIPPPLAQVMAERLQAISDALTSTREKDKRAALHSATAPGARRGRKVKTLDMLEALGDEVLRLAGDEADRVSIETAVNYVLDRTPHKPGTDEPLYTRQSILVEAMKLRQK